jgi:hypothetical protein
MNLGRNPYVILGVDSGAPPAEVTRAFARRSRELNRRTDPPYALEDVTWALSILERDADERTEPVFRIPADPGLFDLTEGSGLFTPGPELLPRCSTPLADADLEHAADAALPGLSRRVLLELARDVDGHDPYHDWTI